jgi:hypothetical protein
MNPETAQKTLAYIQASSALAKRALDDRNELAQDREKAAAGREALINEMIAAEAIGDGQQEKVAAMLSTHADTTALLKSAVARIAELSANQKQAGDNLGQGVDNDVVSGAAPTARNDNYVGEKTAEAKESDVALLSGLGLPVGSAG